MPLLTKKYGLTAFRHGDVYLGYLDKSRFTIIDNALYAISKTLGDGVSEGWEITQETTSGALQIAVSRGTGLVNGFIVNTYNDIFVDVDDNSTFNVYLQRKSDFVQSFSGFSNAASVTVTDTTAPDQIEGLTANSETSDTVDLSWDISTAADLDYYNIYRSPDNITYTLVDSSVTNSFTDTELTANTVYYYKVSAVDKSGNEGLKSSAATVMTQEDTTAPLNPSYVMVFSGNRQVSLLWDQSPVGTIDAYEIRYQRLDEQGLPVGTEHTVSVDGDERRYDISPLENGVLYTFTLFAQGENGVYSSGLTLVSSPQEKSGPDEVSNLAVEEEQSSRNENYISLTVSWSANLSSYTPPPVRYIVTVIENGTIVSDPINVYNSTSVSFDAFISTVDVPVKARTDYIIKVQAVDANGFANAGSFVRITTSNFVAPAPPSSVNAIVEDDGAVTFSWTNSISDFDHNVITITATNLDTSSLTYIENETDVSKDSVYQIPAEEIELNTRYSLTIYCVDEFGNESDSDTASIDSPEEVDTNPPVPQGQRANEGDGVVIVSWARNNNEDAESFKIWRALFTNGSYTADDFSVVGTVSSNAMSFTDYTVVNNTRYVYFVTTVDRYGNESVNPTDGVIAYPLIYAFPHTDAAYSSPQNLTATNSGDANDFDVILVWEKGTGAADGYEIFRSIGDAQSFELLTSVSSDSTQYLDEQALLISGQTYYYMVRKFRNEGRVVVASSSPLDSILIGRVAMVDGVASVDYSNVRYVTSLQAAIEEYFDEQLAINTHVLTDSVDKRINLLPNVIISDWTTSDRITYTATEKFDGADFYVVKVNGSAANTFYSIDSSKKTITFAQMLEEGSEITLECAGLNEISGVLPNRRIGTVFSTQINSGQFDKSRVPVLDHRGRIKEDLIPLQHPMESEDGYLFKIKSNVLRETMTELSEVAIGTSIAFYDIYELSDALIAATSNGLMKSEDDGESWEQIVSTTSAVTKFYFSDPLDLYFALSGDAIYTSTNGLNWSKTEGPRSISSARDITSDNNTAYVSTNLGVFKYVGDETGKSSDWEFLTAVSNEENDCYGIDFDSVDEKLYVTNNKHMYSSSDAGITWEISSDLDEELPVHCFYKLSGKTYALTDRAIWRKSFGGSFEKIGEVPSTKARGISSLDDRLFVTTNDGLFFSSEDIATSTQLDFSDSFVNIEENAKPACVTCVRLQDGSLYIGGEGQLWKATSVRSCSKIYNDYSSISPTVYINGEEQRVGFAYLLDSNDVRFDVNISATDSVSVATQYRAFRAKHGGWIDQSYASDVNVVRNGSTIYTCDGFSDPSVTLNAVSFDTFDETNSNSETASSYEAAYTAELARFTAITEGTASLESGESMQSIVAKLCSLYHSTYSQWIGKVIFSPDVTILDEEYSVSGFQIAPSSAVGELFSDYEIINAIPEAVITSNEDVNIDISSGICVFDDPRSKREQLQISVPFSTISTIGTMTHRELEDTFEQVNSGLPSGLSRVYQSNFISKAIDVEKQYLGEQGSEWSFCSEIINNPRHQANVVVINNQDWYDTSNSTVDFSPEEEVSTTGRQVRFVTSVAYDEANNKVIVGSYEGLFTVDTSDLSVDYVELEETNPKIMDVKVISSEIYVTTRNNVYVSSDGGETWSLLNGTGLPSGLFSFSILRGVQVVAAYNGIYARMVEGDAFTRVLEASSINLLVQAQSLVAVSGNAFYFSNDGIVWNECGSVDSDIQVSSVLKYRSIFFMGTSQGLRTDNGTIYGSNVQASLVDIEGSLSASSAVGANCIAINEDETEVVVGSDSGDYYVLESGSWTKNTDSNLDVVHKAIYVGTDYWLFGGGLLKVPSQDEPIILTTGETL